LHGRTTGALAVAGEALVGAVAVRVGMAPGWDIAWTVPAGDTTWPLVLRQERLRARERPVGHQLFWLGLCV